MNDLALIAIGLLFGIVLAVVMIAAAFLFWTAIQMRKEASEAKRDVAKAMRECTQAITEIRIEVANSLAKLNPDRVDEAYAGIVKSHRTLSGIVGQLNKIVFAAVQPEMPTGFAMDDEAADDARMLAERNRWMAQQAPEVSQEQVNDFFATRRRNGVYSVGSTPPATGAYQAIAEQQVEKPPQTLPDLEPDAELAETGELFK